MTTTPDDVEAKGSLAAVNISANDWSSSNFDGFSDREQFLGSFTAEEHNQIMRKVDRRFLLLIGLMYMLKNIDYMNAAVVKVLQIGEPRNILTELNMTSDEYNWVRYSTDVVVLLTDWPGAIHLFHQLHHLRGPEQPDAKEDDTKRLASTNHLFVGPCACLPRCRTQ